MPEIENIEEENYKSQITSSKEEVNGNISQEQTIEQPETQKSKHETENMEVHHHPKVEKKNFKEYLLEGLMIFLAVTLGFFAENIREKITDNNKEREYMESVVQDLKSDTTELAYAIAGWNKSNSNADSILIYLKKDRSPSTVNVLYNLINRNFFHFNLFKYNDKTIQELKSSGDFRLIRNREITDSIMAFDVDMKYILMTEQDVKDFMMDSKDIESKIFDFSLLNENKSNYSQLNGNTSLLLLNEARNKKINNGTLLTADKQTIAEYYNKLWTFHLMARYHTYLFKEDKKKATLLLEQIQKQYHLEGE